MVLTVNMSDCQFEDSSSILDTRTMNDEKFLKQSVVSASGGMDDSDLEYFLTLADEGYNLMCDLTEKEEMENT